MAPAACYLFAAPCHTWPPHCCGAPCCLFPARASHLAAIAYPTPPSPLPTDSHTTPPTMTLKGRTVLLTGASRGIGHELACSLAKEGAKLICVAHPAHEDALRRWVCERGLPA